MEDKSIHPTISLCMITRDEEEYIAGCLEGVKGIVKEIIIVDTGSNDQTLTIARNHGAKVFQYPWHDDFSAARNESISHASASWILILDADERIDPASREKVIEAVQKNDIDAFLVTLISPVSKGSSPPIAKQITKSYRLFKNFKGLFFTGRVHEEISYSLMKEKARVSASDIIINHLGYAKDEKNLQEKRLRNLKLLKLELESNPDNWYTAYNLGQTYMLLDMMAEAKVFLKRAIEAEGVTKDIRASIYNNLGECLLKEKRYEEAILHCKESLNLNPDQVSAYIILSRIYLVQHDHLHAIQTLEKILEYQRHYNMDGTAVEINIDPAILYFNLGNSYFNINRFDNAITNFKQAIQLKPDYFQKCVNLIVQAYINLGMPDAALSEIQTIMHQGKRDEMTLHLLRITGNEFAKRNQYKEAAKAYRMALEIRPDIPEIQKLLSLLTRHNQLAMGIQGQGTGDMGQDEHKR